MRVLLVGGGGLIGSGLEKALFDAGHETLILDKFIHSCIQHGDVNGQVITGDACSFPTVNRVFSFFKPEAVFHLVDSLYDQEGTYDFQRESEVAVTVAANINKCIGLHGVDYVFFGSSGDVYIRNTRRPVSEKTRVGSVSYSGTTKLYIEDMFRLASAAYKYKFTALRFFQVVGNRVFLNPRHDVVTFFIDCVLRDEGVVLIGPKTYIDILDVTDAVSASYIIFSNVIAGASINSVNIGSGQGVTLNGLYSMVSDKIEGNKSKAYRYPPGRQTRSLVADTTLLESFGWWRSVTIEDELDNLIEFRTRIINDRIR